MILKFKCGIHKPASLPAHQLNNYLLCLSIRLFVPEVSVLKQVPCTMDTSKCCGLFTAELYIGLEASLNSSLFICGIVFHLP